MIEVYKNLKSEKDYAQLRLTLTDLYPDQKTIKEIKHGEDKEIEYLENPVNATQVNPELTGLRTIVSGLHHLKPDLAKKVLQNAKENNQPILVFEISDNSFPIFLWWLAIPVAFLTMLLVTPMIRPITWKQLVFTYLIPILPIVIAWDGAVSNARTYTLEDMQELIGNSSDPGYHWEMGKIKGKGGNKLYLLGSSNKNEG